MADTGPPWNLRFPGPQDFVRETNFYIEDLAEDVAAGLSAAGNPGIGSNVVQATTTTSTSTTSTSYQNTSLTASITPSDASSKVLVLVTLQRTRMASSTNGEVNVALFRGNVSGTQRIVLQPIYGPLSPFNDIHSSAALMFLDSPSSASPVTYTMGIRTTSAGTPVLVDGDQAMVLIEVAA